MRTQFDEWLRQLAAAGKGPVSLTGVSRGRAYKTTVSLEGDWTGATMRAQVRLYPDADGTEIASFTVSGPVVDAGYSTFTLSLSDTDTAAFPDDADMDGVEAFAVDVLMTPSGGTEELLFGGTMPLLGRVTA